jgi:hypothetical protein
MMSALPQPGAVQRRRESVPSAMPSSTAARLLAACAAIAADSRPLRRYTPPKRQPGDDVQTVPARQATRTAAAIERQIVQRGEQQGGDQQTGQRRCRKREATQQQVPEQQLFHDLRHDDGEPEHQPGRSLRTWPAGVRDRPA